MNFRLRPEPNTVGPAGAAGSVWREGSGVPSNGLGVNGDFYLDDLTGDVYQKAAGVYSIVANITGPTGDTGSTGAPGADGAPGSVWREGSGAPAAGLGVDGDFYLDGDTGDVYLKAAGTYSIVANIKGPIGNTGDTGPAGAGYTATSTTSLLIGTGSKAFTTQAGLAYSAGARARASSAADGANYMEGLVTAYSGTTLTINVDHVGGSGTHADWNINLAGDVGATGPGGGSDIAAAFWGGAGG